MIETHDRGTDTDTDTDTDTGTGTGTVKDTEIETGTETDIDTGTGTGIGTAPDTDAAHKRRYDTAMQAQTQINAYSKHGRFICKLLIEYTRILICPRVLTQK